ncbi:TMV resistance protein N [Morella rubra]|uniref:TMV resistance protein N n=1 Tax=Morella rubra TaxID=262757 RepID=A0A6A1WBJ8_9ROSI|nr:TMV resistance protein N [Morella rubra]
MGLPANLRGLRGVASSTQAFPATRVPVRCFSPGTKLLLSQKSRLGNLKGIDLRWSENLVEIPDLRGAPNLERLNLEGCKGLSKVHPHIGVHKQLKELILSHCNHLESLPDEINMESIKLIDLRHCSRLQKFPDIVGNMTSLEHLWLDGTGIKELPSSFQNLSRLFELSLKDCKNLTVLPSVICGLSSLHGRDILDACCINFGDNRREVRMVYFELERTLDEYRGFEGNGRRFQRVLGSSLAHGIPDWFNTRSSGSSVTIGVHNWDGNRKWIGYALFIVYESQKQEECNSWILESNVPIYQKFTCDIESDKGRQEDFLLLETPDVASVGPIGFWVVVPFEWFLERSKNSDGWSYIKASIAPCFLEPHADHSIVEVKECGARLLYEDDGLEFSNSVAQGWHLDYYRYLSGHDF